MCTRREKVTVVWLFLSLFFLSPAASHAQTNGATVSGTVTGASGKAVPDAKVRATNLATGESQQAQTNAVGVYTLSNLAPGNYDISASAVALNTQTTKVTLGAGAKQTMNFALTSSLSLESLGFSAGQTQGSAKEQALLNKRSHMLQIHQKLGLITMIPLAATVISSTRAGGRQTSTTGRDVHVALGSLTTGLYAATAYYAIFAPRVPGVKTRGPIRFHEAMAWIHGPGMILTPILGAMADSQKSNGEKVHGIAQAHGAVAIVTLAAYSLALLSETKPSWIPGLVHHTHSAFDFHRSHAATVSAANRGGGGSAAIAKNGSQTVPAPRPIPVFSESTLKN